MGKHKKEARVDPRKVLMESSLESNSDGITESAAVEPKPKKSNKDRKESVSSEKSVKSTSTKKRKRDKEDPAASTTSKKDKKHKKQKKDQVKTASASASDDEDETPNVKVTKSGNDKHARQGTMEGTGPGPKSVEKGQGVSFVELMKQEREADKAQEAEAAERQRRQAELEAQELETLALERVAKKKRKEEKRAEKAAQKEQEKKAKKEKKKKSRDSAAHGNEGPPVSPFTEPKASGSGEGEMAKVEKSARPGPQEAASHTSSVHQSPSSAPRPGLQRTVSDKASIAKDSATGQPAKGTEVLEKWNVGGLEGGSQRQSKFARLLGAKKQGIAVEPAAGGASTRSGLDRVTNDLEKQFEYGRRMKHDSGGQKRGLGA
ncbi:hypothetical protein DL546_004081 [Coniochaeta pulveracea]|uniref:Small acidic protein n=1 Tax=Coniochaeta pulveracea TaxID=177199 RepID=A0A420Y1Z1_9PEZI|nr:hypothetical protein DL546_004081 [Coniochaeta pulveracea]